MKIYFVGMYLPFIQRVREKIQMEKKEDEVILIPNEYIEPMVLLYYNKEERKLEKIEDFMEHSF